MLKIMMELQSMRRRLLTTIMTKIMCSVYKSYWDERENVRASYNDFKCFLSGDTNYCRNKRQGKGLLRTTIMTIKDYLGQP